MTLKAIKNFNWQILVAICLSLVMGLIAGAIFMIVSGYNPLEVYKMIFGGAFSGIYNIMNTLQKATPLIFTSLAVLVASRAGIFNMGVEGQLVLGAVAAAWAGFAFKGLPSAIHLPLSLGISMLVGALYASIPAILKLRYEVNEILSAIMLNTVATLLSSYLVNYPLRESPVTARTPKVFDSAILPRIVSYSQANVGLFIAIFCVVLFWYIFRKTTFGYRTRMVGDTRLFAKYVGVDPVKTSFLAMFISGALAGLGGGVEILGVHYRFFDPFVVGLGFNGILVAWLGKGSPIGALLAAIFYGGLQNGAMMVDMMTDVPRQLADTILAIIVFFIAAEGLFDWLWTLKRKAKIRGFTEPRAS